MADHPERDWRVTEGPAFGIEPEFELSGIRLGANFYVTGTMSRRITAVVTASAPTVVESLGRPLSQLAGFLRIFDSHHGRTVTSMEDGMPVDLGVSAGRCGFAALTGMSSISICRPTSSTGLRP